MPRKQQSAEANDGAHEMGLEGASTKAGAVGALTEDGGGPTGGPPIEEGGGLGGGPPTVDMDSNEGKEADDTEASETDDDEASEKDDTDEASEIDDNERGHMAIVSVNRSTRSWVLVYDVAWTEDNKLQGTLFGSDRRGSAIIKGVARDLQDWLFFSRCVDNSDQREFNGTPENKARYIDHAAVPFVFDLEKDIIVEGFRLLEGCIPSVVVRKLSRGLTQYAHT